MKDFMGYPKLSTKKPWAVNFPLLEKMDLWGMNSGNTSLKNISLLYFINPCQDSMLKSNNLFGLETKGYWTGLNLTLNRRGLWKELTVEWVRMNEKMS